MKTIKLCDEKLEINIEDKNSIIISINENDIVNINGNRIYKSGSVDIDKEEEVINVCFEKTIKLEPGKIYKKGDMLIKLTWADKFDSSGFFQRFHFYGFNTPTGYFKSCFDINHGNYHGFIEGTKEEWNDKILEKASKMSPNDIRVVLEELIYKETQKSS